MLLLRLLAYPLSLACAVLLSVRFLSVAPWLGALIGLVVVFPLLLVIARMLGLWRLLGTMESDPNAAGKARLRERYAHIPDGTGRGDG
ncbi:MAG: hypothetical protein ACOCYV_00130 [Planctomycetota bacterium]